MVISGRLCKLVGGVSERKVAGTAVCILRGFPLYKNFANVWHVQLNRMFSLVCALAHQFEAARGMKMLGHITIDR